LATMSPIDAKMGVRGEHDGLWKHLGHAHEAGIGKAHGDVLVLPHERDDRLFFLTEPKRRQKLVTPK